ncbi:MAG TPA: DUF4352 domain-containing protein [Mycobacterium sp.]|nr:DUF4352 domain-containing protein [Mycobacterium sp.]
MTRPDEYRRLIVRYVGACAALLAVLIFAIVYAVFIHDAPEIEAVAEPTTVNSDTGAAAATATTQAGAPADRVVVDGPLSFTLTGVETGTVVSSTESPAQKRAAGEFIVVRMSVVNTGGVPTQLLGMYQKLFAGGMYYFVDDEATFYVGGGVVEIPSGARALVGVAYDVPPGTPAESIELHADPVGAGVQLRLS